ncbi:MAG: hypothetical protein NTU80_10480 [Verrucomicrobia bacterium]|nr:hypothetical protein [Verrucomicrobiota bacterium]
MPASHSPPGDRVCVRTGLRRMAAPTSCLLLILAANQSAALSDASLPYLAQGAPEAMRFASAKSMAPRPARPVASLKPPATDPPAAVTPESNPKPKPDSATATSPPAANPLEKANPAAAGSDPASTSNPSANPNASPPPTGVELVPDTYSPRITVRVEDLLPFFAPPGQPVSKATYEMK